MRDIDVHTIHIVLIFAGTYPPRQKTFRRQSAFHVPGSQKTVRDRVWFFPIARIFFDIRFQVGIPYRFAVFSAIETRFEV